jgi:large repetitive protein
VTLNASTASATCATAPPGCPTITLSPSTLPNGIVGVPYRQTLAGTGGTAPVSVSLVSGGLGALTITTGGLISGTPFLPFLGASFTCTLRGTDAAGCFNDYLYSLTVTQAVPTLPEGVVLFLASGLVSLGYLRLWRRRQAK